MTPASAYQYLRDRTRPVRSRLRDARKQLQWRLISGGQQLRQLSRETISRLKTLLREMRVRRKRPSIKAPVIGITGSSGKSTTTLLLSHILAARGRVHSNLLRNKSETVLDLVLTAPQDVDSIIAECGAEFPGEMAPLALLLRPTVVIVTKVGVEHYSAFRGKENLAQEKAHLVAALPGDGLAILNADDPLVMGMAGRTAARVVTFGWSEGADYRVVDAQDGLPRRLRLTIACDRGTFDIQTAYLDRSFWLATAAAFAAAVELGMDPAVVAERIGAAAPVHNRMMEVETAAGVTFILDTAKAPAESIATSLDVLGRADAPYKTAVIGQISDYPGHPASRYRDAYRHGLKVADRVIFVGENMHRSKATPEEIAQGRFTGFTNISDLAAHIRATARPGELILLKSSLNLHLERIALDYQQPVRCWENRCGKKVDCLRCGLTHLPFEKHPR